MTNIKRAVLFAALLICWLPSAAREVYDMSANWKFYTCDERDSVRVNLPHTWNNNDVMAAGQSGYYRGAGNYMRHLKARPEWRGKRVFMRFYGANAVTDLMVNGRHAGQHKGGNNAFDIEVTDYLDFRGNNLVWVIVNNSARTDVLPTAGDENVYGGLFRKVELIVTGESTIGFDGHGGSGVLFAATAVNEEKAAGSATVSVNAPVGRTVSLDMSIEDADGNVVYTTTKKQKTDKKITQVKIPFDISQPRLWHGVEDPYMYNVTVKLTDGANTDAVTFGTGLRSFDVDAQKGFQLNGRHYPLRGVVVYRDRANVGNVLSSLQIAEDIRLIREMGANAVRIAGGSHHPEFYEMCDREGIIVLADSPFVGATTFGTRGYFNTAEFRENALMQLRELIYQRYNNPSVMFWGVFSDPELIGDDPIPFIKDLNSAAKVLDPVRMTVGVSNKDGEVNSITDLIVWDHSFGWRTGMPDDIKVWKNQLYRDPVWGKLRSAVSYRAAGSAGQYVQRLNKPNPDGMWHPENWQAHVHERHLVGLDGDERLWAVFAGDMFDHGSVKYTYGAAPGINNCGLVTFDRAVKKDAFWLYKANWNEEDLFIHIASKGFEVRESGRQTITAYSNASDLELFVNGESKGMANGSHGVFVWKDIALDEGRNSILVKGVVVQDDDYLSLEDSANITYVPNSRI